MNTKMTSLLSLLKQEVISADTNKSLSFNANKLFIDKKINKDEYKSLLLFILPLLPKRRKETNLCWGKMDLSSRMKWINKQFKNLKENGDIIITSKCIFSPETIGNRS